MTIDGNLDAANPLLVGTRAAPPSQQQRGALANSKGLGERDLGRSQDLEPPLPGRALFRRAHRVDYRNAFRLA